MNTENKIEYEDRVKQWTGTINDLYIKFKDEDNNVDKVKEIYELWIATETKDNYMHNVLFSYFLIIKEKFLDINDLKKLIGWLKTKEESSHQLIFIITLYGKLGVTAEELPLITKTIKNSFVKYIRYQNYRIETIVALNMDYIDILKEAAEDNNVFAQLKLGILYASQHRYSEAFELFKKAHEGGNILAHYELAKSYLEGRGVQENIAKAYHIFDKCSKDNLCTYCGFELAKIFERMGRSFTEIYQLYKNSSQKGCINSTHELIRYHLEGKGDNRNDKLILKLLVDNNFKDKEGKDIMMNTHLFNIILTEIAKCNKIKKMLNINLHLNYTPNEYIKFELKMMVKLKQIYHCCDFAQKVSKIIDHTGYCYDTINIINKFIYESTLRHKIKKNIKAEMTVIVMDKYIVIILKRNKNNINLIFKDNITMGDILGNSYIYNTMIITDNLKTPKILESIGLKEENVQFTFKTYGK